MDASDVIFIKQHLIDPEICIRCNTCEAICPVSAITHDSNNYVVDADKCNLCMACVSPCPTGSIDNWRTMPKAKAYSIEEQFGWESLPEPLSEAELAEAAGSVDVAVIPQPVAVPSPGIEPGETAFRSADYGATVPPWSAAHAYTNLYGPKAAAKTLAATVTGNVRVTAVGKDYDVKKLAFCAG